jgi:hypothetical protein
MSDKTVTPAHVQAVLLEGKIEHHWDYFGTEVVMKLFGSGRGGYGEILRRATGPDEYTRGYWRELLSVAYALKSFGGWDFDKDQEQKEEFVEGLSTRVLGIFVEQFVIARNKDLEDAKKREELLGKSSPSQR